MSSFTQTLPRQVCTIRRSGLRAFSDPSRKSKSSFGVTFANGTVSEMVLVLIARVLLSADAFNLPHRANFDFPIALRILSGHHHVAAVLDLSSHL